MLIIVFLVVADKIDIRDLHGVRVGGVSVDARGFGSMQYADTTGLCVKLRGTPQDWGCKVAGNPLAWLG